MNNHIKYATLKLNNFAGGIQMARQNGIFLALSIIVVMLILLVGILLAEGFISLAFLSFLIAVLVMGYGFRLKKKWRTSNQ